MNKKYEYLKYYLEENRDKPFEECFEYIVPSKDNYIYLFIANDQRTKYIIDKEKVESITKFETNDFVDIVTPFPVVASVPMPVISYGETSEHNDIVLRHAQKFYVWGIAKMPKSYWKENPGVNNYRKFISQISKYITDNDIIPITGENWDDVKKLFDSSTQIEPANVDLTNTTIVNDYTGKSEPFTGFTTDIITAIDLEHTQHNKLVNNYEPGEFEYKYESKQVKAIVDHLNFITEIIKKTGDNDTLQSKIAHKLYNPYCIDLENLNWYEWTNLIKNQYDGGVLITEHYGSIIQLYKTFKVKYIDTFSYPKYLRKKETRSKTQNVSYDDPNWKTVENKLDYLQTKCEKIGQTFYTKDTHARVCCEHDYCNLIHQAYPKNLVERIENFDYCKFCGEQLGDHIDDGAFVEGMTEINEIEVPDWRTNKNMKPENALRFQQKIEPLARSVDNDFFNSAVNVNRFADLWNKNGSYYKFKGSCKCSYKSQGEEISNYLEQVCKALHNVNNNMQSIKYFTQFVNTFFISNSYIAQYLESLKIRQEGEIDANKNNKEWVKEQIAADEQYKNYFLIMLANIESSRLMVYDLIKWYSFLRHSARGNMVNHRQLYKFVIKSMFTRSRKFLNMLWIMIIICKIRNEDTGEKDFLFDFNTINWKSIFTSKSDSNTDKTPLCLPIPDLTESSTMLPIHMTYRDKDSIEYNKILVEWINMTFDRYFKESGDDLSIRVNISAQKITFIDNPVFKRQQELINQCYNMIGNEVVTNNVNNIISTKVIDAISCPEIRERKFDKGKSFKELLHAKFPTIKEYYDDYYNSRISIDSSKRVEEYTYVGIINFINKNFIDPIMSVMFKEGSSASNEMLQDPSIQSEIDEAIQSLSQYVLDGRELTEGYLNMINLDNECQYPELLQRKNFINAFEIGIDDTEKLIKELYMVPKENEPVPNYDQDYENLTTYTKDQRVNTFRQLSAILIRWMILCTYTEGLNNYMVLNNSIENLHNYVFNNGLSYNILANKPNTYNGLIEYFCEEFFDYNNYRENVNLLKYFFDNLKINTQLFISPTIYTEDNVRNQRLIKRANNIRITSNVADIEFDQQESDLREFDRDEQEKIIDRNPIDNTDFVNAGMFQVEELSSTELLGGEFEGDDPMNEGMY